MAFAAVIAVPIVRLSSIPTTGLSYKIVDLGVRAPSAGKAAVGGTQFVGMSENGVLIARTLHDAAGDVTMFLDRDGTITQVALPAGYTSENPVAVNDSGQVAVALTPTGSFLPIPAVADVGTPNTVWSLLPCMQANCASDPDVIDINDSGSVVGVDGGDVVEWKPSNGTYVENVVSSSGQPATVDDGGWIAGSIPYGTGGGTAPVILAGPGASGTNLGVPQAVEVSNQCTAVTTQTPDATADVPFMDGEVVTSVVGAVTTKTSCSSGVTVTTRPIWWQDDFLDNQFRQHYAPVNLITPKCKTCTGLSATSATATGVNVEGWIVGTAGASGGLVYLHRPSACQNVQNLLTPADRTEWKIVPEAAASPRIDASGEILTTAVNAAGTVHDVLLVPNSLPKMQASVFTNGFNQQAAGSVLYGSNRNEWSGDRSASNLAVENEYFHSAPNALDVTLNGSPSAYVYKVYQRAYTTHTLIFALALGQNVAIPSDGYIALCSTETGSVKPGLVELTLGSNFGLSLTYVDANDTQQYIGTNYKMAPGGQYLVELDQIAGSGTGEIRLVVNGGVVAHATGLDLGTLGVGLFNVGNVYSPTPGASGNLYVDDVETTGS